MKKFLAAALLFLVACARHDDIPPPLGVAEPPAPTGLVVETVDDNTCNLSWGVDDPSSLVDYFRYQAYSVFDMSKPEVEGTTPLAETEAQIHTEFPLSLYVFCVSTVSKEKVESSLTCKVAE